MTELAVKEYLEGNLPVEDLASQLAEIRVEEATQGTNILIEMVDSPEEGFVVTRQHLVQLCDDVIKRHLREIDLNSIAYNLILSSHYNWDGETEDGEIVSTTLFDWDSSDTNHALSRGNIKKWKTFLITGEYKLANSEEG